MCCVCVWHVRVSCVPAAAIARRRWRAVLTMEYFRCGGRKERVSVRPRLGGNEGSNRQQKTYASCKHK